MSSIMTSRQAAELDLALERCGWTAKDVKDLSSGDKLEKVLLFVRKLAKIKIIKPIINCSAQPFIPGGWSIHPEDQLPNRITTKDFEFNPKNFSLYLSDKQKQGAIGGNQLKEELKNQKVLTANVLDYLLEHPELIPEEWKGKAIFFWGTIYRNSDGFLSVRYLFWDGDGWRWLCRWLDNDWLDYNPAVCVGV